MMNELENSVPFDMWLYKGDGTRERFFIDHLFPWIQCLYSIKPHALFFSQRNDNKSCRMLCEESDTIKELIDAIEKLSILILRCLVLELQIHSLCSRFIYI